MNNETNNIDDLFDDSIGKSMSQLGFLFPKSIADFKKIENEIRSSKMPQIDKLKDPFTFLNKRSYKKQKTTPLFNIESGYGNNLAQAAREGNQLSEELLKKMAEDKLKAKQQKKDN